jgi:CheY-like chemotaxis protein
MALVRIAVASDKFANLRILIVEDEALVAMLIEDTLLDLGCTVVSVVSTLDEALARVSSLEFDAAILDVNLNGCKSYPVAFALAAKSVPFLFSTGYGLVAIPDALRDVPVLAKPFEPADLERTLATALR